MDNNKILFVKVPQEYICKDALLIHIPKIKNKINLLSNLSVQAKFPDYFGYNWDALCEVYRDFYWIDKNEIVIIHDDLSELNFLDLKIYIEIVEIVVDFWKSNSAHNLVFVFSENDKKEIINILEK